jgi:hypothetical protein
VGLWGAEISNSFICNNFSSLTSERLETTLFRNGCLEFRSPSSSDFCLKLKSSMISASFQAWTGDLQTAASSSSLFPTGVQTPLVYMETSGDSLHCCGG